MATEQELREMDEALERARAAGITVNEEEGETEVCFVGEKQLKRVRELLEEQ